MTINEKSEHISHRISDGMCGINTRRPVIENCKCGEKLNLFFEKLTVNFTAFAKKNGKPSDIFTFDFCVTYQDETLCSIFFEKFIKNGRYIISYTPFSVTFLQKSGTFLSLPYANGMLSERYRDVKKTAQRHGINISFSEFSRCYYLVENGAVIYKSVFAQGKEIRKTSECIRKFYISDNSVSV